MLVNRAHPNGTYNVFLGNPETSQMCATIYPYDGGYLWEVRVRCDCCNDRPELIQTGSARMLDVCLDNVNNYLKSKE